MDAIFTRTSVRAYADKPIEEEKIERILRAAMQAPSAKNQQPWEFAVVDDAEVLQGLSQASPYTKFTANAPLAIVVLARTADLPVPEMLEEDLGACTEHILLEAAELGIGSCWQGIHPVAERKERIAQALGGLPQGVEPFALVALGYPKDGELPAQKSRYDESRVHRNRY